MHLPPGVIRQVQDRWVPPHDEFVAAEPPTGRVIVIAPTRAACETIELAVGLHIETYLEKHHGERVRELARSGKGAENRDYAIQHWSTSVIAGRYAALYARAVRGDLHG